VIGMAKEVGKASVWINGEAVGKCPGTLNQRFRRGQLGKVMLG